MILEIVISVLKPIAPPSEVRNLHGVSPPLEIAQCLLGIQQWEEDEEGHLAHFYRRN